MNIWRLLTHLPGDLKKAEADITSAAEDPEILAELDKCPKLKAKIAAVSADWRAVEKDVS